VKQRLKLHKTDTDTLIELYYEDRLMEQQRVKDACYGVLSVRAYYHHDSLCVEVLKAHDVIPLDPNGKPVRPSLFRNSRKFRDRKFLTKRVAVPSPRCLTGIQRTDRANDLIVRFVLDRFQRPVRHRRASAQVLVPVQRRTVHRREKENVKSVVRRVFRIVSTGGFVGQDSTVGSTYGGW